MLNAIKSSRVAYLLILLYVGILGWWIYIQSRHGSNEYLFNWSYGLIALTATGYAWFLAFKRWGGLSSVMGRLLFFLGLGLFLQWCGLQVWTYYNVIKHVEVPYPSWADAGYFGLVPAYTIASLLLAKACNVRVFGLGKLGVRLLILVVPIGMVALAFFLFLKDIGLDGNTPIKTFFDLGYPIGEIIPATFALMTALLISRSLGGIMRTRVFVLIFAFIFQFFTEYLFLYQSGRGTYVNGGVSDLMYATSYLIMGLSISSLSRLDSAPRKTAPEVANAGQ